MTTQMYAEKARLSVVDFTIDYTPDIDEVDPTDQLATSVWTVAGDLVIDDGTQFATKTATVWVSGGGNVGEVSRLTNIVTTVGGRTFHYVLLVKIVTFIPKDPADDPIEIPIL